MIKSLSINNFKSIKTLHINDLNRINLFIGKPNVGKTNIIEALSLFTLPFLKESGSKKLTDLIRVENETELFHNGDYKDGIYVEVNNSDECNIKYHPREGMSIEFNSNNRFIQPYLFEVDDKLQLRQGVAPSMYVPPYIIRYAYKHDVNYKKGHAKYLIPPFGPNLLAIIEQYNKLKADVQHLFSEYGLKILFDKSSQTLKVIQTKANDEMFLIPYNSIADTLQRIIFYKAAIISNEHNTLLFEEPEAHSFPPYMSHLTQEMIYNKTNQYIIATHSPFILNDLLENAREDLGVFTVSYKDHETKVKKLTDQELHEVFQYGVDLFTNYESYL
ncbi:hypothetical protein LX64_01025 [Chitinophaga skermanii]|uniref:Endonuclease GajA/Old nuclease/RecF-like AAA domain-containing protein n=1 Tax=Chitinophaga skermanii TaxID=331697 RepID=A0A327QWP6_9BACT|nr:AAA family ATPase [Chitinophaga skermanii]RAJ08375.1 hypothetical protein LX64_01025 [Chitinophaga skermanii]